LINRIILKRNFLKNFPKFDLYF
jgi:hypothetical protein